ncbi:MAG: hypothetical protein ACRCZ5_06360, partial [Burkholderiales bacterium]
VYDAVLCPKCIKPFGLAGKNAIHCVTLLENNPLLSASRALRLAFLPASAAVKLTSTEPKATGAATTGHVCHRTALPGVF